MTRNVSDDRLYEYLENFKGLLILIANKCGASQREIGEVLGIGERHVRRLMARKNARSAEN